MAAKQRGRPRSTRAQHAILEATRDLLASSGYEKLTMEAIAARAGVGKQTVYRRWSSKAAVVAEAVIAGYLVAETKPPADSGDVAADLRDWLRGQFDWLGAPSTVALVRGLAAAAAGSATDAERLYEQLTGPSRQHLTERLAAGVRQGQLRPDADLEAVADAVAGTLLYRALAHGAVTVSTDADRLLDILLTGVAQPADTSSTHSVSGPADAG
ncbi:TetR/AcrR family transcriptional regulator [Streptomyces sp. B21-101]|uniref:TetR/AcrR family transcriptional regulator n=1 Tax=Streptomyces sp. B21-101 TaxID=3039415 RepID=UPI002FEE98A3